MKQETKPQDTSTRKDELDITKREWDVITETIGNESTIQIFNDKADLIACVYSKPDAEAICTAVNSTYGKGYNPAAMEELYKALDGIIKTLNHLIDNPIHAGLIDFAQTALKNAKTIKP